MQKHYITSGVIRFHRWARKAYAIFASIGRNITIGYLKTSIVDKSVLTTGKAFLLSVNGCNQSAEKEERIETDEGIENVFQEQINILYFLSPLSVKQGCGAEIYYHQEINNKRRCTCLINSKTLAF